MMRINLVEEYIVLGVYDIRNMLERIRSFRYAIQGLVVAFKEEANLRIHICATVIVILLGFYLGLENGEWLSVVIIIGFVITTELLNTAIENICNHITRENHPMIKKIKDVAAGAVLVSSVTALVVGFMVFVPKLVLLFQ